MAVESSAPGALRESTREMMRESYPAAELFQKAHARMVMLHRLDEQLAALAEQRRRHEQELSVIQGQINAEFNRALKPATERRELASSEPVTPAASVPAPAPTPAPIAVEAAEPAAPSATPAPAAAAEMERMNGNGAAAASKARKKGEKLSAGLAANVDPAWLRPRSEKSAAAMLEQEEEDD
jgi:hypothetical protein